MREVKNLLRKRAEQNADFYIQQGLLDEQTVKELPINNYASIKFNKPIDSLTDAEKIQCVYSKNVVITIWILM